MSAYKIILIGVFLIIASASVGFADIPKSEMSIIDNIWHQIVSSDGSIVIDAISINVTNTSVEKYRKYYTCSQITLTNGSFGDAPCATSLTLSPFQNGTDKQLLKLDFKNNLKISEINSIVFDVKTVRTMNMTLKTGDNISLKSDDVSIIFKKIQAGGNVDIKEVSINDVQNVLSRNSATGQVTIQHKAQNFTSISTISNISTNVTLQGDVTLELSYNTALIPTGVSEKDLKLMRFSSGEWTDITSTINTEKDTVQGVVSGFSDFMVVSPPSPSANIISQVSSGSGGGEGSKTGKSASSVVTLFEIHIYEVSWNTCNDNIVTVVAGPPSDGLGVKLRTKFGIIPTKLSDYQPFSKKSVFEARIDPSETFVIVQAEGISSRRSMIVQETVNLDKCSGSIIFESEKNYIPKDSLPEPPVSKSPSTLLPPTEFPSKTPSIPGGKQFETSYNEINFEINYKTDSGQIREILVHEDRDMLILKLDAINAGNLVLSLPRGLIDAVDDEFVLFETETGNKLKYTILKSEQGYVVILLVLPDEISEITILGTSVIPEFGLMTAPVLLVMILLAILVTRHFQVGKNPR